MNSLLKGMRFLFPIKRTRRTIFSSKLIYQMSSSDQKYCSKNATLISNSVRQQKIGNQPTETNTIMKNSVKIIEKIRLQAHINGNNSSEIAHDTKSYPTGINSDQSSILSKGKLEQITETFKRQDEAAQAKTEINSNLQLNSVEQRPADMTVKTSSPKNDQSNRIIGDASKQEQETEARLKMKQQLMSENEQKAKLMRRQSGKRYLMACFLAGIVSGIYQVHWGNSENSNLQNPLPKEDIQQSNSACINE